MTTQQVIEEIQEKIADKTLSFGCRIGLDGYEDSIVLDVDYDLYLIENKGRCIDKIHSDSYIIWHPVSLSRVLSALSFVSAKTYLTQYEENYKTKVETEEWDKLYRKLFNEDWSDAYLQDQPDETIQALHTLIVR